MRVKIKLSGLKRPRPPEESRVDLNGEGFGSMGSGLRIQNWQERALTKLGKLGDSWGVPFSV